MVKIFRNDLQTRLSHLVGGKVHSGYAFNAQQNLNFLSAVLSNAIFPEGDHLETPHIYDPAEEFPQGVLGKTLNQWSSTLSL